MTRWFLSLCCLVWVSGCFDSLRPPLGQACDHEASAPTCGEGYRCMYVENLAEGRCVPQAQDEAELKAAYREALDGTATLEETQDAGSTDGTGDGQSDGSGEDAGNTDGTGDGQSDGSGEDAGNTDGTSDGQSGGSGEDAGNTDGGEAPTDAGPACTGCASGQVCHPDTGDCVDCFDNTQCQLSVEVCNTATNTCVQCTEGTDCPGQQVCNATTNTCACPSEYTANGSGGCALNPPSDLAVSPATYSPSSALTVTWYFSTGVTYQVRYRRTDSWVPDLITDAYYVVPPTIYQPGEEVEFCVRAVDGANVSEAACLPLEFAPLCEADFRVAQNTCSPCPNETHNLAGDDPYGGDTACDDTPFSEWRKAGRQTNGTFLARAGNSHFAWGLTVGEHPVDSQCSGSGCPSLGYFAGIEDNNGGLTDLVIGRIPNNLVGSKSYFFTQCPTGVSIAVLDLAASTHYTYAAVQATGTSSGSECPVLFQAASGEPQEIGKIEHPVALLRLDHDEASMDVLEIGFENQPPRVRLAVLQSDNQEVLAFAYSNPDVQKITVAQPDFTLGGGIGSSSIVLDLPKAPNNQAVVLQQLRGHGTDLFVAVNHPDGKGLLKKYRLEEYSFLGFRLGRVTPQRWRLQSLNDAAVETLTHLEVNETYAVTGAFVANGAVQLRAFDHSLNLLDAEKIFAADGENVTDLQGLAFQPDSNRLYLLHGRNNRTEMFGAELGISSAMFTDTTLLGGAAFSVPAAGFTDHESPADVCYIMHEGGLKPVITWLHSGAVSIPGLNNLSNATVSDEQSQALIFY